MEIVGGSGPAPPLGATAFLCSRPDEESHEIGLFADPSLVHIAFKVCSLAEFRSFHARIVEKTILIKFVLNQLHPLDLQRGVFAFKIGNEPLESRLARRFSKYGFTLK